MYDRGRNAPRWLELPLRPTLYKATQGTKDSGKVWIESVKKSQPEVQGKDWAAFFDADTRAVCPTGTSLSLICARIFVDFMLDTDICIYLLNERDAALRGLFESHAAEICISAITHAELCYGVSHSGASRAEQV